MSKPQNTKRVQRTDVVPVHDGATINYRGEVTPSETYRRVFDAEMSRRGLDPDGNRVDAATSGDAEARAKSAMKARSAAAWQTTRDDATDPDQPSSAPVATSGDAEARARAAMNTRSASAWKRGEP